VSILLAQQGGGGEIVVTGALIAQASVASGTVVSGSTLTGALTAQAADVSGLLVVSDAGITLAGALSAQAASAAGTVVSGSTISGALSAQASSVSGSIVGESTVSGVLAAQSASASGAVTSSWLFHSPDVFLLAGGADRYLLGDSSGFYQRSEIALEAQSSQVSGLLDITGGPGRGGIDWLKKKKKRRVIRFSEYASKEERIEAIAQAMALEAIPMSAVPETVKTEDDDDEILEAIFLTVIH
jgi:hypothetical protein